MRRVLFRAAAVYLALSIAASAAYNLFPAAAWDIASHRHGLIIVSVDQSGIWFLNPFSCAADDWIFSFGGLRNVR